MALTSETGLWLLKPNNLLGLFTRNIHASLEEIHRLAQDTDDDLKTRVKVKYKQVDSKSSSELKNVVKATKAKTSKTLMGYLHHTFLKQIQQELSEAMKRA